MQHKIHTIKLIIVLFIFNGCGTYFKQPIDIQKARLGEETQLNQKFKELPKPLKPLVVGVYKLRDQTGQYKAVENGSTFSTAVTQGATTILIKALQDSKWFRPIERENLNNLLNERNIIRSTRKEYVKGGNSNEPQLPPLLYAGILLEGGIISYDTNIMTGGVGARYFGVGGSSRYRQDRISLYLRVVSTSNGEILKTVYVSKTILSQAIDASFFRYVKFQRLLEAETGFTRNEPVQLAVKEAIEKAVESLILEGIDDGLWKPKVMNETAKKNVEDYRIEKENNKKNGLYNRLFLPRRSQVGLHTNFGVSYINGDYIDAKIRPLASLGASLFLHPSTSLKLSSDFFQVQNESLFKDTFSRVRLSTNYFLLPYEKLSPILNVGLTYTSSFNETKTLFGANYGVGMEYLLANKLGIQLMFNHHFMFNDDLDGLELGKRNDQLLDFTVGFNFYLGKYLEEIKKEKRMKREKMKNKSLKKDND